MPDPSRERRRGADRSRAVVRLRGEAQSGHDLTSRGLPSAGFSITIRVGVPADPYAIGRLTTAVGEAGGIVTALDVVDSDPIHSSPTSPATRPTPLTPTR